VTPWNRVLLEKLTVTQLLKKFPAFYGIPKLHYCVQKNLPLVPILSAMYPTHNFPPYFLKIHSNITLPSTNRSSEWSLLFSFSYQNIVCISHFFHACYKFRSRPPSFITTIIFGEVYKLWSLSLCSLFQPQVTRK
jgi:hypothetical protein